MESVKEPAEKRGKKTLTIGFAGNPNSGKTTLFNAYTGARLKVANWPGVTVEKKEGAFKLHGHDYKLVDLPGTYSLEEYTMEEAVVREYIKSGEVDALINVADASCLERSLYLTLQLAEMGIPVIVALNMMDIVEKRGMEIDLHRLPELIGMPCVPVSARRKRGLDTLIHAAAHHIEEGAVPERMVKVSPGTESLERYAYIERVMDEVMINREKAQARTDRADKLLTHPVLGLPAFLAVMGLIFFLTFTAGDFIKGYWETFIEFVTEAAANGMEAAGVPDMPQALVLDGLLAGVGGMLSFLPNIFVLFLALAVLEDSGYMSRVAYVTDGLMSKMGLSGKSFIPMLLGFGCSVPAVMATRSLENMRDRKRVMLIVPFMSCGAKLPIYVLFAGAFFPEHPAAAMFSMYILGAGIAILSGVIMRLFDGKKDINPLLIELPEYKAPASRTVFIYVWEKVKDYLSRAGTIIVLVSVVMWALMSFGPGGYTEEISSSFGSILGKGIVWFFAPIGLGFWQIAAAIIAGLAAKEVVVASTAVLFGVSASGSAEGMAEFTNALGAVGFTTANALSLMVFCLLYPPCIAALATIKRESGSWKQTGITAAFQAGVAWVASFVVYRVASAIL